MRKGGKGIQKLLGGNPWISTNSYENPSTPFCPPRRINRIGTGVHRHLALFRSITFSSQNAQIARSLGFRDPRVTQSQIITKSPHGGAQVLTKTAVILHRSAQLRHILVRPGGRQ